MLKIYLYWHTVGCQSIKCHHHCKIAGGDNWPKKHEKLQWSTLFVQFLHQTKKAQSMTPQTTKYRCRTVIYSNKSIESPKQIMPQQQK